MRGARCVRSFALLIGLALVLAAAIGALPAGAAMPGSNGLIAFSSAIPGNNFDLVTIKPDGNGRTLLTKTPDRDEFNPSWSPGGDRVVYEATPVGDDETHNIYVINADGSGTQQLTSSGQDFLPTWSPDGRRIAFVRGFHIFVMNDDGTGIQQVTFSPFQDSEPAWSPDGTKIAFARFGLPTASDVLALTLGSPGEDQLTFSPGQDRQPDWSPDGSEIAFASNRSGNWEVWVMNSYGHLQANLTNSPSFDAEPAWSPDGKRIALFSDRDGNGEVFIMHSDGTVQANLTANESASDFVPSWQPTGLIGIAVGNFVRPVVHMIQPAEPLETLVLDAVEPVVHVIDPMTPSPPAMLLRLMGTLTETVRKVIAPPQ